MHKISNNYDLSEVISLDREEKSRNTNILKG